MSSRRSRRRLCSTPISSKPSAAATVDIISVRRSQDQPESWATSIMTRTKARDAELVSFTRRLRSGFDYSNAKPIGRQRKGNLILPRSSDGYKIKNLIRVLAAVGEIERFQTNS